MIPALSFAAQSSSNKTGAVAGAGFEYRLAPNVSVFGELLWYGFGNISRSTFFDREGPYTTQFDHQDILSGTLGVNYRF